MEAIRQMKWELGDRAINVHLTYVPYLHAAGELKTKPTQHSVKELQSVGIQPDVLVLRTEKHLDEGIRKEGVTTATSTDCVAARPAEHLRGARGHAEPGARRSHPAQVS